VPGLTLHNIEIKFRLYTDDLILLNPTKEGLQQSLDLLDRYCQTWALAVNIKKTKSMIFQKRPRCLGNTLHFTIGTHKIVNCFDQWEKHSIEIANTEFCKSILQVHRTTTNNACRAELGQYPLLLKIQKRSIKYWLHLKQSDPPLLPAQSPAKPRDEQESPHSAGPEALSTDRFPLCSAPGPVGEHIN
jgi:hypothetical protein